jgi:hypothetical protein
MSEEDDISDARTLDGAVWAIEALSAEVTALGRRLTVLEAQLAVQRGTFSDTWAGDSKPMTIDPPTE